MPTSTLSQKARLASVSTQERAWPTAARATTGALRPLLLLGPLRKGWLRRAQSYVARIIEALLTCSRTSPIALSLARPKRYRDRRTHLRPPLPIFVHHEKAGSFFTVSCNTALWLQRA